MLDDKTKEQLVINDDRTLRNSLLTDPETGDMLAICSTLHTKNKESYFYVRNIETKREWKVTFKIEEC